MQTYSHLLLTAALNIPLAAAVNSISSKHQVLPKFNNKALLFGSILPDLALIIIALVCIARDWFIGFFKSPAWQQFDSSNKPTSLLLDSSWTVSLFGDWFFNNPAVITLQNTFHSPLILIALITICYFAWHRQTQIQSKNACSSYSVLFWIFCASLLHTIIDIPLHSTDGPLLFFPLDWNYRFASPISYWDPNYYGHIWSFFEHCFDIAILLLLIFYWRKNKTKLT